MDIEDIILDKMEANYRKNAALYNTDENVRKGVNECVLKLQRGDPELIRLWRIVRAISIKKMNEIYELLNVCF